MSYEQGWHARFVHADAHAVAGDSWLRDLEESGADAVAVADTDVGVGEAIDCEVFAELSKGEVVSAQFSFPVVVRIKLIDEDCAVLASVAGQIALAIAVYIEPPHYAPARNGSLPDGGVDGFSFP
jgi:hypothetical protein